MADRLRAIASQGSGLQANVLAKIGDSMSVTPEYFLGCFAQDPLRKMEQFASLQPTIDFFFAGRIAGVSSLMRASLATKSGMGAEWGATPDATGRSPTEQELLGALPQFAVIMFGTNDLHWGGADAALRGKFFRMYAQNMLTIIDAAMNRGVVPILSTIPHLEDRPTKAPVLNAVIRGLAQWRGIPVVDLYAALWPLPAHGLGPDGTHPSVFSDSTSRPCFLTEPGLRKGYNTRNLVTLQALDRVRAVVSGNVSALDPAQAAPSSVVGSLPFVGVGHASYRLTVTRTVSVRALALSQNGWDACRSDDLDCSATFDHDLRLISESATLAHDNTMIVRTLEPGAYDFSVDDPNLLFVLAEE